MKDSCRNTIQTLYLFSFSIFFFHVSWHSQTDINLLSSFYKFDHEAFCQHLAVAFARVRMKENREFWLGICGNWSFCSQLWDNWDFCNHLWYFIRIKVKWTKINFSKALLFFYIFFIWNEPCFHWLTLITWLHDCSWQPIKYIFYSAFPTFTR